jgi:hypothetical protein
MRTNKIFAIVWKDKNNNLSGIERKVFTDYNFALHYAKTFQYNDEKHKNFKIEEISLVTISLLDYENNDEELFKEKITLLNHLPKQMLENLFIQYDVDNTDGLAMKMLSSSILEITEELVKQFEQREDK